MLLQTSIKQVDEYKEDCFNSMKERCALLLPTDKTLIPQKTSYPIDCKGKTRARKFASLFVIIEKIDKYLKACFVERDFDESINIFW